MKYDFYNRKSISANILCIVFYLITINIYGQSLNAVDTVNFIVNNEQSEIQKLTLFYQLNSKEYTALVSNNLGQLLNDVNQSDSGMYYLQY